jgi:hypothetical protein
MVYSAYNVSLQGCEFTVRSKAKFALAVIVLGLSFVAKSGAGSGCFLYAQEASGTQEKSSISGTVIDAVTQQPLRDAEVRVHGYSDSATARSQQSTVTDNNGRFAFDNLPPGSYSVAASHTGYMRSGPGMRRLRPETVHLIAGQHVDDLRIYLNPGAVISGQITEGAGVPVAGTTVQALRHSHRIGQLDYAIAASAQSNNSGEYQLMNLPSGDYYLRVVPHFAPKPKPEPLPQSSGQMPEIPNAKDTYIDVTTYYPGTAEEEHATLLNLRGGEQLSGMNVALSRARASAVKGRVIDAVSQLPIGGADLTLLEEGNVTPVPYSATADVRGNFEVKNVPRGNYVLVAEKPTPGENDKPMWGQKRVLVANAEVDNVEVAIQNGATVSGRIVVDGKANVDLTTMTGLLQRTQGSILRGFAPEVGNITVKADGSFGFQNVGNGNYYIDFVPIPAGYYLKCEQAPNFLETGLAVAQGQAVQGLELVLSPGVAKIEGTVMNGQEPSSGATVVLVPSAERRSQPRFYRLTTSDQQGRFAVQNIIPGDYEVFAWQELESGSYFDPDFIARFEDRSKAVSFKEGSDVNLQLDVIPPE